MLLPFKCVGHLAARFALATAAAAAGEGATAAPAVSAVDQPDGTKVDLRVGVISKVWVHESADT